MKLSIIIVSWNVKDLLKKCLNTIFSNMPPFEIEIIVVDNASTDGSVEFLKDFRPPLPMGEACPASQAGGPGVRAIINPVNLGFSAANNQGIEIAKGEYILFLNPDTEVKPDAIEILASFMDDEPKAGVAAPKLLNPDGSLQRSCLSFPTISAMAARQLFLEALWPDNPFSKIYLMKDFKYDTISEVDQPMGACFITRKSILDDIEMFDEASFMFFDEVDLCFRIKKAGWKIFFLPEPEVVHHGGSSIKKWGFLNLSRHWTRSRNYFFKKNFGSGSLWLLYLIDALRVILLLSILMVLIKLIMIITGLVLRIF